MSIYFQFMLNQHKILRVLQLISLLKKEPSKSIKFIAGILESTDRTVYRYLDLVKELGFDLQRDSHNRFYIVSNENNETLEFSNGNELNRLQILNLKGDWSAEEVRDDMIENISDLEKNGWDKEQVEEFYQFLLED